MTKKNYLVELNWYGEIHKLYTSSYSKQGALSNTLYQLANKTCVSSYFIKHKFNGDKDNYKVTERTQQNDKRKNGRTN